jgi:hypothetical protein
VHMVVFTSAEGRPSYYQTETLEDAIKFVERVRNTEGVEDAKLYRMAEIPLQVKTYVKVELATGSEGETALVSDGRPVDPMHATAER